MTRPLLFIDVDGVLNPYAAPACPAGFIEHNMFPDEEPVRINPQHGSWINELLTVIDICWATGWNDNANRLLGPLLGLSHLPVIPMPDGPFEASAKVERIAAHAGHRPAAWIDDIHTPEAHLWARERAIPTLLISADPSAGLARPHVDQVRDWARRLPRL